MQTIDATNEKLGRVATRAAAILIGKDKTTFVKNKIVGDKVKIINASKLLIDEKKRVEKTYARYSGYPGGLKKPSLEMTVAKKGYKEILRHAVSGMLPKNKLRTKFLLNLEINE
ncbi:MAG TPA: 50S ribosomal protein L13 [Candidatus Paceibacterota bacterium]